MKQTVSTDFSAPADIVRLVVEGERLAYGHLFNPTFATEISQIEPLPHQRIAVYDHMLPQSRLRFLLADDAGAGKTIMTGLYIREMLTRHLISRVLIVTPAGLVGNWEHEIHTLFNLPFHVVTSNNARQKNPFVGQNSNLIIVSIDTLRGETMFRRLQDPAVAPYDLVVFDEAHKLTVDREADLRLRKTERFRLAEALAGGSEDDQRWMLRWHCHHLLLLSATPHMGKDFPYYGLWKLLEPDILATIDAFNAYPPDARRHHFIRRTKEEMVDFHGKPIYPPRITTTLSYDLGRGLISEQTLYEETTNYIQTYYNRATMLNRSAVRLAMSVFQRRLASSTYALLCSFERRQQKLLHIMELLRSGTNSEVKLQAMQLDLAQLEDTFAVKTAEEEEAGEGFEENERVEENVLGAVAETTIADIETELYAVDSLLALARQVYALGEEAKFEKLRTILQDSAYKHEKLIIFTEHRDTLDFLTQRLEGMGFADQIAQIHGGMDYAKREAQVAFFRKLPEEGGATFLVATDAAGEGINLQCCHLMVNYDIPWNPARLEQRMGRIHRFGQKHPMVSIINLVAGKTREGRVLQTILEKLENIRKELGSDKVFDVIGQLFEGLSLRDYMEKAIFSEDTTLQHRLEGILTREQIQALDVRNRHVYGDNGEVHRELPRLKKAMEQEIFRHLLPGYTRHFLEHTARLLEIDIEGNLDGVFSLRPRHVKQLDWLQPLLSWYPPHLRSVYTITMPPVREHAIFLHPGEPIFEQLRSYICSRFAVGALRGAVFVDPAAQQPYFFHLARVTVKRKADPGLRALHYEIPLITQLIGIKQGQGMPVERCSPEQLLLLRDADNMPIWIALIATVSEAIEHARNFAQTQISGELVEQQRQKLLADLSERTLMMQRSFTYQGAELAESRRKLTERVNRGETKLRGELTKVKERQKELYERRQEALTAIQREPDLIVSDEIRFLAHALVIPASDENELYDGDVETIAVRVARAYEESLGAIVQDVSTSQQALIAGLGEWPGFDLYSLRPSGERIAIEVKGRADIGDIELSENEFVQACNLRERYWLYVVFECAKQHPRLCRIQDPFSKLAYQERKHIVVPDTAIFRAEEI